MKRIFITRRLPSIAKELLSKHFYVEENNENKPVSKEKLMEVVSSFDGILSTISDNLSEDVLINSNIKVISNYAVGLDNINLETAKKRNIAVYNTPDVVTDSTADMTFALLLSLIRKISHANEFVKKNNWSSWDPGLFLGEELRKKTFGIIGFGKIGKEVAKRASGFGLNILVNNKSYVNLENFKDLNIKQVELDYLFRESDYVSIHLPLNQETYKLINKKAFSKMEKKPIIINISRGAIVDTDELVEALKQKKIRGACLDVTDPEPLSGDHELCNFENCLIVPHLGTATKECRHNMAKLAAENIIKHYALK